MNSSKISQLIALADEFEQKTVIGPEPTGRNDYNNKYQAQRDMLAKFHSFFSSHLRATIGQMESDLGTLRERDFDKDMWSLLARLYKHLETIYGHINFEKPYSAARELVEYVNDRRHRSVIDNLEFLAHHHLEKTTPETSFPLPSVLKHITEAKSLEMLKELATQAKEHIENNPLIVEPITTPPPGKRDVPGAEHPSVAIGPEEKTRV